MQFELTRKFLEDIQEVISNNNAVAAKEMISDLHAADIADIYEELSMDEAKFLYQLLDSETAADVLTELEDEDRERFLEALSPAEIAKELIDHMDSDDAADIIGDLPDHKQKDILLNLKDLDQAGDIADLLNYDEDTAGGLMAKELIKVNINWSLLTCIREMRKQAGDIDEIYYVYVVDDEEKLKGTLSLKKLLLAGDKDKLANITNYDVISVKADTSSEDVAHIMDKYDLVALPVIDAFDRLIGRITIDDVVDVIREEADKDYQLMSGISEDVEPTDSVWILTRARLPWLLVGLIGGILGAQVMSVFEAQLAAHAAMAFFIPLIAAMGGNVGVQSSAIVVQGLANNTIGLESTFRKIMKEIAVAMLNGITLATIIFIYNFFFSDSLALTFSVSVALFIVIIFASTFGTFVPLALNKMKIDPALATGPFITTVNDILGLFIYLSIGKLFYSFML